MTLSKHFSSQQKMKLIHLYENEQFTTKGKVDTLMRMTIKLKQFHI